MKTKANKEQRRARRWRKGLDGRVEATVLSGFHWNMSQPTALGGELPRATYTVLTGTGSPDVQVTSRGSEPRRSPILQIGRLSFLGHPHHGTHVPGGFDLPCLCSSLSLCRDGLPSPPLHFVNCFLVFQAQWGDFGVKSSLLPAQ